MKLTSKNDSTLHDLMTPEKYIFAESAMKVATDLSLKTFDKMKPAFISTLHTTILYMKLLNVKKQPDAVEKIVQDEAKN